MKTIDAFDKQIILALSKKGAVSPDYAELGRRLKKPKTTVHSRIKRLQEQGILKGFKPIVYSEESTVTAFMMIGVKSGTDIDKLSKRLISQEDISEVHYVTGDWCMILKIEVASNAKYYDFSSKIVKNFPEITEKIGMLAPKSIK